MTEHRNALGQPIGFPVPGWTARPFPPRTPMIGRYCRVEPLDIPRHGPALHAANRRDAEGRNWTYLSVDAFTDLDTYGAWLAKLNAGADPVVHAIVDGETGKAVGIATFMRIDPASGVIEVGNINFSPLLQRKTAATESMFLMARRAFEELGYRRYEWKCDSRNLPSRAAAERFGFRYEGIFRQAVVTKGRNRDTAWYSMLDSEWPGIKAAFERWLDPMNFDADGNQRIRLGDLTRRPG